MSNPQAVPQANPEGVPLAGSEQTQEPGPSGLKRFFKIFAISRLFGKKKAPGTGVQQQLSNPTEQEEMHEMQTLPNDSTDPELPRHEANQEPQLQSV